MKKVLTIILILISTFSLTSCSNEKTLTRSNLLLDTIVEVTLYKGGNEEILDESFNTIRYYDDLFDAFDQESEVGSISTIPTTVSDDTLELIEENLKFYNLSSGNFNPYLGTLISLWDFGTEGKTEAPSSEEINTVLEALDYEIVIDEETNTISLANEDTKLNLGASVKGFVADQLKKYLVSQNVSSAIINLGGNVLLIGDKDGDDFVVGIDNPEIGENTPIATLTLRDKSIVTSGNYQRYFYDSEGNFYHHILNPSTGYPVDNNLKEVIIVSDSSLLGDLLSTTCFIMGETEALDFLRANNFEEDLGVIFVDKDNHIEVSSNLKDDFSLQPEFDAIYTVDYFDL